MYFAVYLRLFCNYNYVSDVCFCVFVNIVNVFCRHSVSERKRKMHSTVLRFILHKACVMFVLLTFCASLHVFLMRLFCAVFLKC